MPHGRALTAEVEEASAVVVGLVADTPEVAEALEQAAVEVESGLAERGSQVELRTLVAQDPASLHLGIHHMGGLSIRVQPADRQFRPFAQRLVGRRTISTQHATLLGNGRR
jgi:hypothetical protein